MIVHDKILFYSVDPAHFIPFFGSFDEGLGQRGKREGLTGEVSLRKFSWLYICMDMPWSISDELFKPYIQELVDFPGNEGFELSNLCQENRRRWPKAKTSNFEINIE